MPKEIFALLIPTAYGVRLASCSIGRKKETKIEKKYNNNKKQK